MNEPEPVVRAVSGASFATEVLERSGTRPVVVDFWAAWCGPCRMVAPVLERLAAEYAGRAEVVKLDTDAEPEVAARYGVRSLPTLALFTGGALADALVGAQPEAVIRVLIERHLEQPSDRERAAALAAARAGDVDGAVATLARLVAAEPGRAEHLLALIDVEIDAGRLESAAARLDAAPVTLAADAALAARRARLELAQSAGVVAEAGTSAAREAAAAREFLAGRHAEALDAWLGLLSAAPRDRTLPRTLKAAFTLLGDEHELVARSRRRMASLMH